MPGVGLARRDGALLREIGPAFATAIERLLRDEQLRATIACQARQTVEHRFGWDSSAREALRSYDALLGRRIETEKPARVALETVPPAG